MPVLQYLRILSARKWTVLLLALLVAGLGIVWVLQQQAEYRATASLVVDMRPDPALGAIAPALASPAYLATQLEVMRSDRVVDRVMRMLDLVASPQAQADWREATDGEIPIERYYGEALKRNLDADPVPGSNVINIQYTSTDPAFAQAAANAFAEAYMQTAVELRVAPARQSADFLEQQAKSLRAGLEQAQEKLASFQQSKGILTTDESLDQENARYQALVAQLTLAEAERVDTSSRQRLTGSDSSPDVMLSPMVTGLKSQLATAQTKLSEISSIVGPRHPTRLQLEAQIAELQRQIATEVRRVAAGTTTVDRGSSQKVGALRAMVEQQKKSMLALRADRDQAMVLQREVQAAQRAYDAVSQRLAQLQIERQNTMADTRLLNPASLPLKPSASRRVQGLVAATLGGLLVGIGAALLLEWLDRRVRSVEDLTVVAGVPVIGVLRPPGSRRPVFRRLQLNAPVSPAGPQLAAPNPRLRP